MLFDPYCHVDCKNIPITEKILKHIGLIHNGFYIEAGAYDGLFQSNTKILEEKLNWTGILVEPSPTTFLDLVKNRPNNININKCLVDYDHTSDTISGTFDNGPMSSVNNIRPIRTSSMIDVPCIQLEKILDEYNISRIDFMSLDTEGYELNVLKGMNLNKYTPQFLLIEIYDINKDTIIDYLKQFNYQLLENITNYNIIDNPCWDGTHNDYLFKYMNNELNPFDIVIPVGPNDIKNINTMINHTKKNIIGYRNIYLISYDSSIIIDGCITIDENIFPFNKQLVTSYIQHSSRSGWYLQQLLKLYASFVIHDMLDNYLVIDSDTFFIKPTLFFKDNKPLYNVGTEYHVPYFDHMNKLHSSLFRKLNLSGICHHMMFQKQKVIHLFKLVEDYHNESFYISFLKCINQKDRIHSGASEYEIYINYLHIYHQNEFLIRKLKWKNTSIHNDNQDYDYVSDHWYTHS